MIRILLVFLLPSITLAALSAKVKFVKGKVTILAPNEMSAKKLKRNDLVFEGSSILTQKRSFVRIEFKDKTSMNIGPESKVVLKNMPKEKANVVNLLTGMIKTKVKKKKKSKKTKFIVKTPSAVLGVRGTKFQSMFNPSNQATTLVTVEGNVAMAKLDTPVKELTSIKPESVESLEKTLSSKNSVEVKAGRFSGVKKGIKAPSKPIKIAPKQYNAIASSMDSTLKAKDVMKPTDISALKATKGIKPGGFVDFKSGLYIEPTSKAKIDPNTGTFKTAKYLGKVDSNTGDYIPPKGIKIDENKGFVVVKKTKRNKLIAKKLNEKVQKQLHTTKKIKPKKLAKKKKNKWLPKDHRLAFVYLPFSEDQKAKIKSTADDVTFTSDNSDISYLLWTQVWNDKWSSRVAIGGSNFEVDNSEYDIQHFDDKEDGYFSIGLGYKYSENLQLYVDRVSRALFFILPFPSPPGPSNKFAEQMVYELNTFEFTSLYKFYSKGKLDLHAVGSLELFSSLQIPSLYFESGMGYHVPTDEEAEHFGASLMLLADYKWNKKVHTEIGLWAKQMNAKSDNSEYEFSQVGLKVGLEWNI